MNQPRDFEHRPAEPPLSRWDIRYNAKNDEVLKKRDKDLKKEAEKEKKAGKQPEPQKNEKDPHKKEADKKPATPEQKQEKRAEIIERSQAYKKQFEEVPIPNNATTVAKLIVAEHILALNEQLHASEEAGKPKSKKELEEGLDYMCLLAEKFEDPSVEPPPEIQLAYETLLELTHEALQEAESPEEAIEEIIQTVTSPEKLQPQIKGEMPSESLAQNLPPTVTPLASPSPPSLPIVTLLSRLKSTAKTPAILQATPPILTGGPSSTPLVATTVGSYTPRIANASGNTPISPAYSSEYSAPDKHPSISHTASEYHEAMQPKTVLQPLAAVALASVVAAKIHKGPEVSHRHEYTTSTTSQSGETTPHASIFQPEPHSSPASTHSRPHTEVFTPSQKQETNSHSTRVETITPTSSRKLEHMTTHALLELAHSVSVGHGRYLAREYKHGHIDRDGLIKVLKAKKKGFDISREYSVQAANLHLRRISPEFLRKSTATNSAKQDDEPSKVSHQKEPTLETHSSQQAATSRDIPHPLLERFAQPEKSMFQTSPKNNFTVQIVISIAAVIIFGLLILLLF